MHSDNPQNWTLEGQTVLWFLIIFYYLDCTKCKFPDFSLTFPNIHFFPWPSTKFPDFSLTFPKSGISLTFPWPLDTLLRNKLQWNFSQNSNIFIQENALENIVCEMVSILSRSQWVNSLAFDDVIWCYKTGSTSVQIMAWCQLIWINVDLSSVRSIDLRAIL